AFVERRGSCATTRPPTTGRCRGSPPAFVERRLCRRGCQIDGGAVAGVHPRPSLSVVLTQERDQVADGAVAGVRPRPSFGGHRAPGSGQPRPCGRCRGSPPAFVERPPAATRSP